MTGPVRKKTLDSRSRFLVALTLCSVVAFSCSSGTDDGGALAETAEKLSDIKSGDMSVEMTIAPSGGGAESAGFTLEGAFDMDSGDDLPLADMEFTRLAGGEATTFGFISTGQKAFVEIDGQPYELAQDQLEGFAGAGSGGGNDTDGLGELQIGEWVRNQQVNDGGTAGGAETDRITADLDVVKALNDLFALAGEVAPTGLDPIEGDEADQLERSVETARLEVLTGKDDRLLRHLEIDLGFGLRAAAGDLQEVLGDLAGATLHFEMSISDPNRDVEVDEPPGARPLSELTG